jgi:transposase
VAEKNVLMSQKEARRWALMLKLQAGELGQAEVGWELGISVRQVKRLLRRFRLEGEPGLISKKRGAPSHRRIDEATQARFVGIVQQQYADFGPELAREYLAREHGFTYSTETLRGWMIQAQLWQAKARRMPRIHPPRARRGRVGELVQIDGSHHDWFEGRWAKCCLIAFIDDASSDVLGARFEPTEAAFGYFDVLRAYVLAHGSPVALYSDRHSIFTKHDPENGLPTQFERALLQLNIEPICAHTPQAKGRVERLFKTLQDRLCKAMRLEGINNIEQANVWLGGYLERHNAQFGVKPQDAQDAHRVYEGSSEELARICALHHQRQLSSKLSCQFEGDILQVDPGQTNGPKGRGQVDIAQHKDGSVEVLWRGQVLRYQRFAVQEHLRGSKVVDAKEINSKVDEAIAKERVRLAKLQVAIAHQDSQRAAGIYTL